MSVGLRSEFLQAGGIAGMGGEGFPNPFLDVASTAVPRSFRNALYWAEYIYMMMGSYRMAMDRIISYFMTRVEIGDADDEVKTKFEDFLEDPLDVFTVLKKMLTNRQCYGNGFASVIVPFKRFLSCRQCQMMSTLKQVHEDKQHFDFAFEDMEFVSTCPSCSHRGPMIVRDLDDDKERRIHVKHWSPHEIELIHDPYTDEVAYTWRIPEDYKQQVRKGNLFHLERASKEVLKAIKNNQVFRFKPGVVFHMKEPTLAGIRNRGWGIPRILSNFRQIYYVQVLHRYNEAIALDYVIPFRLLTPMPRTGGGGGMAFDPILEMDGGDVTGRMNAMLRKHRRDPATWHVLPFPVQYQALGGDASNLAPRDLLDQGMETLLNDVGTPIELYKGSLQLQTAPVALRLFESTHHELVHDANSFLRWLTQQLSQILSWETVSARLQDVSITDDVQKMMAALQLMMGEQLSGTTGLRMIGQDWKREQKLLAEEARTKAEIQARTQEELNQAGLAQQIAKGQAAGGAAGGAGGAQDPSGGAAAGGAGAGAAGDPSAANAMAGGQPVDQYVASMGSGSAQTPEDLMSAAQSLADQLMGQPESVKDSQLRKLKQTNPVLHSLVRARIDQIRRDARSQGGAQVMAQQYGQGAAA